jgi:hypothetical protein
VTNPLRNYTRWVQVAGPGGGGDHLVADILGGHLPNVVANYPAGQVQLDSLPLTPDEARLIGVRLIEGAALADGPRAIRVARTSTNPGPGGETPDSAVRPGRTPGDPA